MRADDARLLNMLLAARDAVDFAAGRTVAELDTDRMAQLAVLKRRTAEIVGEGASRVSAGTYEAHPDIPWRKIIDMRNRLLHACFEVNLERVRNTVQRDISALVSQLEPLVPPETE